MPRLIASPGPASGNEFIPGSIADPPLGNLTSVTNETSKLWICVSCGWIYDPAEGDPDGGIPPGTLFEEIPDDWFCPVCGARKSDFEPYEG